MIAATRGYNDIVEVLIKKGADINKADKVVVLGIYMIITLYNRHSSHCCCTIVSVMMDGQ